MAVAVPDGVTSTATALATVFSRSPAISGTLALEILRPGGRPAGNNEDGDTEEEEEEGTGGGGIAEGVEEAAVVVITMRAGGIDLRFKLRHGFRAARRRSTTERVRRAFLQEEKKDTN